MIYIKTDKGRAALLLRDALSLRERQVMVLCNGARTHAELAELFGAAIGADLDRLERRGLLAAQLAQLAQLGQRSMPGLLAALADSPQLADTVSQAVGAQPPTSFMASRIDARKPPAPEPELLPRMSLEDLVALANVPAIDGAAVAPVRESLAGSATATLPPPEHLANMVNSIDAEHVMLRTPVAAQAYMTQVLMALEQEAATQLVESHGDVRHDVDILLYLAQGLGQTYAVAGEDVSLRVAMRVGRLLPEHDVPMLLDCALDYVPASFSVLLYEFVLAGRDTVS